MKIKEKNEKPEKTDDISEMIREDINMPKIVMLHIMQISRLLATPEFNQAQFNANIYHLRGLLSPVFDDQFKKDNAEILEKLKEEESKFRYPGYNRTTFEERQQLLARRCENYKAQLLFEALCKLAQRVGVSWEKEDMADFDV